MLQFLIDLSPLLNVIFLAVLVPIWTLAKSLKTSKDELSELKKLNKSMVQELTILKIVVFQYLPDEAAKTYMKELLQKENSKTK
ncbi:MAG: hypothetical protein GQ570_10355 [Helicobacteraceae bacterium]|nr:hypothetical protein [Helicobacteraceae bacterium]